MVRRASVSAFALALFAGLVVTALPLAAWACPMCAGRSDANPYANAALIGGFVFFPFGVAYTILRYIRAGMRSVEAAGISVNSATDPLRGSSTGSRVPALYSMDDGDRR